MKKIVTGIALILFLSTGFSVTNVFSEDRIKATIVKDIILKKRELIKNSSKGELYIQALDAYFEKYANDTQKIQDLIERVSTAKVKLGNSVKEQEILLLIEYIEYKGELILLSFPKDELVVNNDMQLKKISNMTEEELGVLFTSLDETQLMELINKLFTQEEIGILQETYINSLKGYSQDVKNAKIASDIRTLATWIETEILYKNNTVEYLLGDINIDYSFGDTQWYIGTPNYDNIGYGGRESWLDSYGYEYQIAFYKNSNGFDYQVLGFSGSDTDNLTANIKGNYIGTSPVSLFKIYKDGEVYNLSNERTYLEEDFSIDGKELYSYIIYYEWYLPNNPDILTGYESDAKNSKTTSDLRTIATAIEISLTDGSMKLDEVVGKGGESYEHSRLGTIITGPINFSTLRQSPDDFYSSWEHDYRVSYNKINNDAFYQVLGLNQTDDGNWEAIIKGNYIQIDDSYPVGLFKHPVTGEYLENGDIISAEDITID